MERKNLYKNKRGDVTDIITFLIIVFFLATSFLVVGFTNDKLKDVITDTDINDSIYSQSYTDAMDNITTNTLQNGFVAIFAFLIIGMMVSSFMVKIHPIFLFMYVIFLAIASFVAVPLANAYQMLMNAETIATVAGQQTTINWIMEHLVLITVGAGVISMIVTFAKLNKPAEAI